MPRKSIKAWRHLYCINNIVAIKEIMWIINRVVPVCRRSLAVKHVIGNDETKGSIPFDGSREK